MAVTESKLVRDLVGAIKDGTKEKTKAYETPATVTRIEDGTAWVHVPGGVEETPVQLTINATEGDQVRVRVANGKATIVGNVTSPPTDDSTAKEALANANSAIQSARNAATAAASAEASAETAKAAAEDAVETAEAVHDIAVQAQTDANTAKANAQTAINNAAAAQAAAANAQNSADSAQTSADNASEYAARALGNLSTVQNVAETLNWITAHGTMTLTTDTALDPTHVYFVQDNNGDYTVGGTKYAIVTEPDVADISTYYELSIDESLNNYVATHLAVDSEGLWIVPDAGSNKVLIATGQGSTYTSAGTYIVGKVNNVDTVLAEFTADRGQIGQSGETHLIVSSEAQRVVDKYGNTLFEAVTNSEASDYPITNGARGDGITKDFNFYNLVSETVSVQVDGVEQTEGVDYIRNNNVYSFFSPPAAGADISITAKPAVPIDIHYTLGARNAISGIGDYSVVEGALNVARGYASHAEGALTKAMGQQSHAEGDSTVAFGSNSHAQNLGTIANSPEQTAIGRYNDNQSKNAFEIGNGKPAHPSNAFTVDWSGNVEMALDTSAASGTDKEIYDALVSLGWTDCIV